MTFIVSWVEENVIIYGLTICPSYTYYVLCIKWKCCNLYGNIQSSFLSKMHQMSKLSWFFPIVCCVYYGLNSCVIILFQLPVLTEL